MPHQEIVGPPVSRAGSSTPPVAPRRSVLSRIGQGVLAFGAGTSSSAIDTIRSERDIAANRAELGRQQIEANQAATQQQQETQRLVGIVQQGNAQQSRQAADRLFQLNPELADSLFKNMGATSSAQREDASRRASEILQTAPQDREAVILRQVAEGEAQGRDMSDTLSLIGKPTEEVDRTLNIVQSAALSTQQRFGAAGGGGVPAQVQTFNALSEAAAEIGPDGKPTPRAIQAQTALGTRARAGLSAQERIAVDPTLTTQVAGAEAFIAGATQLAKTQAQITTELRNAGATAEAAATQAALVEKALTGERIKAGRLKTAEQARVLLPDAQAGAQEMVALLNDIRNDPNLPNVLGVIEGRIDIRIDEDEIALLAKIDQVLGKTFLEAYQSLKGGGPITDREGQAATEAQSRLTNRAVSLQSYQGAIDELIGITDSRLARLTRKANLTNIPVRPVPTETEDFDPSLLEFMTPEERALFEQ